ELHALLLGAPEVLQHRRDLVLLEEGSGQRHAVGRTARARRAGKLIEDIKALRLDTFDIADRLRSWRAP
ncbi:hypothetical protein AB0O83_36910, partial [Streptomyces sp. NPDC088141]